MDPSKPFDSFDDSLSFEVRGTAFSSDPTVGGDQETIGSAGEDGGMKLAVVSALGLMSIYA